MKRMLALVLVLALVFGGCSSRRMPGSEEYYTCVEVSFLGESAAAADIYEAESSLTLYSAGTASLAINGSLIRGKWEREGDSITITASNLSCSGSIAEDWVRLQLWDSGFTMVFAKPGSATMPKEADPDAAQSYWNRDWYGWWVIHSTAGEYSSLEGSWWDALATTTLSRDGTGSIVIWDEISSFSDPLAACRLQHFGEEDETGTMVSLEGGFMDDACAVEAGDWLLWPQGESYPDTVVLEGSCSDERGAFSYYIMLRPWGTRWEDVEADDPDKMPYYYHDWYLPAMEKSEEIPPISIGEKAQEL